jgi:hypothetical protein
VLVELGVVEQRYDAVKEVLERRATVTEVSPFVRFAPPGAQNHLLTCRDMRAVEVRMRSRAASVVSGAIAVSAFVPVAAPKVDLLCCSSIQEGHTGHARGPEGRAPLACDAVGYRILRSAADPHA